MSMVTMPTAIASLTTDPLGGGRCAPATMHGVECASIVGGVRSACRFCCLR